MEQAGRILRAHASRKQMFLTILPLLSEGLIILADEKRPARKDHRLIREQVQALREEMEEADTFLGLVTVVEQACNVYLTTGIFPKTYETMQPVPVLHVGQLTYAGDDGMAAGQTYRSPTTEHRRQAVDWGAWLSCAACGWNGSRDYAASLNIARLGMAFLATYQRTQRYTWYRMTSTEVKTVSYSGAAARLLLPVQGSLPRPVLGKKVSYAGWVQTTALRTSQPRDLLSVLSTARCRRLVLQQALTYVA
jgi:hypothetical protein